MTITILGKRYRLRFGNAGPNSWGHCDEPNKKAKEIIISPSAKGLVKLDTIIHECGHAAFPNIKEESIEQFATDLARVLTRLGYREGA